MITRINSNSVRLCCSGKGCPVITDLGDGTVKITDDNGNTIVVKKEEAELLSDGVRVLDGKQLILG
jgi:hypothetical protein